MDTNKKIFLSYRRDDSADVTGRIKDRLAKHFGQPAILRDVDSIPLGVDFRAHIDRMVSECDILLAIIGKDWLHMTDEEGNRRLDNPEDFVRIEIESALARKIPVVPLLVRQSTMPSEDNLPSSLKELAYRNGIAIRRDPDFDADISRLIEGLQKHFSAGLENIDEDLFRKLRENQTFPATIRSGRTISRNPFVVGAGILLMAILIFGSFSGWFGGGRTGRTETITTSTASLEMADSPTEPPNATASNPEATKIVSSPQMSTPTPDIAPAATDTPVATLAASDLPVTDDYQPTGLGTPLPGDLEILSPDNTANIQEIARWEKGQSIYGIAVSPNEDQIAIGLDGEIAILDPQTGSTLNNYLGANGPIGYLFYLNNGEQLASGPWFFNDPDDRPQLWDLRTGEVILELEEENSKGITSFAVSQDGQYCASGIQEWTITIRNCATAGLLSARPRHLNGAWVMSVAFSHSGRYLASGGEFGEDANSGDGMIRVWTVPGGGAAAPAYPMDASVLSIAFSPNQESLIVAGTDTGRIEVFLLDDGVLSPLQELETGSGSGSPIRDITFSPNGELIVAANDNGEFHIWRTSDWTLLRSFTAHESFIYGIEFSHDGRQILTVSRDYTIGVWGVLP